MDKSSRIYVAGHRGLVGSAICRRLQSGGYTRLIIRDRADLDLTNQAAVEAFFRAEKPEYVFLAAAKVGGILANSTYPADFLRDNLAIELNVIDAAYRAGVKKLEFLGSSCIYPRLAPQPMREEALLSGPLEPTNEWYAIAKIAGIKLAQAYWRQYGFRAISLMPTNLYGPGDNFDFESSHVLPALIRKAHQARIEQAPEMVVWGSGAARREFLFVDDLADAAVFLMLHYDEPEIINVGAGTDVTIRELAELVQRVIGYQGRLAFDASKPDGPPRKLLDGSRLQAMGWHASTGLEQGIAETYDWFLAHARQAPHAIATSHPCA
ncbi:MAG TPA: GDP-L-fucose synthase [Bryobacteraceae bacterium]|nr:GDP-L-fucose synthase [Bryobacteraceae bacterium]